MATEAGKFGLGGIYTEFALQIVSEFLEKQTGLGYKYRRGRGKKQRGKLTIYRSSCERHRISGRRLGVSLVKMYQVESQSIFSGHV